MEIGELVDSVFAFPGNDVRIAIGCESGKLHVFDTESEKYIFSVSRGECPVISITSQESNILYVATEEEISIHDIREKESQTVIFKAPSEISDFDVNDVNIAVATMESDIVFTDKRILKKPKASPILPPVCNSLKFRNRDKIVAGYIDTSIGEWTMSSRKFTSYMEPGATQNMNPPVVHCVATKGEYVVAATQNSLKIFKSGKLVKSDKFEHDEAVQYVTFAPFIPGNICASASADGSLMILDIDSLKVIDCISNDDERVQGLAANDKFLAVADTSDSGSIGIFTPDDFGSK